MIFLMFLKNNSHQCRFYFGQKIH